MDVLEHNNLNCPSQRGIKEAAHFLSGPVCYSFTVPLWKRTDISMLWKEQSLRWREQVKISLWIISPPDPCHCCRPYTWQRQKEMILLFQPKPVLLVYALKEGQREGEYSDGKQGLCGSRAVVCQLKRLRGPKLLQCPPPAEFFLLRPSSPFLCLSPDAALWLSSPGSIEVESLWNKEYRIIQKRQNRLISWAGG